MRNVLALVSVAVVAGAASANTTDFVLRSADAAGNNGVQVEVGGPGSSPFFMNAQGNGNNQFAEFYVMEFDLSAYSGVAVQSVEILLTHSETFFTNSGGVSLDYTADDATSLSSLTFDSSSIGGNNGQLAASDVSDWTFTAGNDGVTFTYSLTDNGGLFADIQSGGIVRLILEATDADTSATYEGFDNDFGDRGPILRVTEVPAPGAAVLAGVAGLAAVRRRR